MLVPLVREAEPDDQIVELPVYLVGVGPMPVNGDVNCAVARFGDDLVEYVVGVDGDDVAVADAVAKKGKQAISNVASAS